MALIPTQSNVPEQSRADLIKRITRSPNEKMQKTSPARFSSSGAAEIQRSAVSQTGFRLRTAVSDADIESQILRLQTLIANDNIEFNTLPGSYFNVLI